MGSWVYGGLDTFAPLSPQALFLRGQTNIPLQYSCLENPQGQRSLADFSPCGRKELDTTERLSTTLLFGTADIGKVINVKRFCNLCSINIFFINIIASFVFQKSINSLDASKCIVYLEFLFWHHF